MGCWQLFEKNEVTRQEGTDGEEPISSREHSGWYFAACEVNTGIISSGKTTHSVPRN